MMHAPAPVAARDRRPTAGTAGPTKRRKTGLIGCKVATQHNLTIARGAADEKMIAVVTRSNEDAIGRETHFVCLHERCADKEWASLSEMYQAHPAASVMEQKDEIHLYALWCDEPVNEGKIEEAEVAAKNAEARATKAKDRADKLVEDDSDAAERARERAIKTRGEADRLRGVVGALRAPLGLIAPPEPQTAERG